jgi:plastocyanin
MSRLKQTYRDSPAENLRREMEREEGRHRARRRAFAGVALMVVAGIALVSVGVALAFRGNPGAAKAAATAAAAAGPEAAVTGSAVSAPEPEAKPAVTSPAAPKAAAPMPVSKPAPRPKPVAPSAKTAAKPATKHFDIAIGAKGYEPERIVAKAGVPISLTVGRGEGCAAGFELPALGMHGDNSAGPATLSLGRLKAGTYTYTCSMGMVSGKLVVR